MYKYKRLRVSLFNIGYDKDNNPTGNNNDKALELYNPFDTPIDLSNYRIECYSNGLSSVKDNNYVITLSSYQIDPHDTFLISASYACENILSKADYIIQKPGFLGIGAKSSIGLFKNNQLIDVFGEIGKSYDSNNDFVINSVPGALDLHNVIRKPGFKNNLTFTKSEWEVRFDNDFSSLGAHNFSENDTNLDYKTVLNELVTYWRNQEVTGDIELIKEYKGFSFRYDFYGYYYDVNGKQLVEPENGFILSFALSIYDGDTLLTTSYDAYITYKK
ncbi:MAG: hypothetical protein PUA56_02285 [Bacillales bacterium]|nr:hypothetical protein [Bacillales bacterium]